MADNVFSNEHSDDDVEGESSFGDSRRLCNW